MKEDKLEKFIRHHRAEFDDAAPPPELWEKIESTLPPAVSKPITYVRQLLRIAAIFVLGAVSYACVDYFLSDTPPASRYGLMMPLTVNRPMRPYVQPTQNGMAPVASLQSSKSQEANAQQPGNATKRVENISPEFAEMQSYYAMQIQQRRREIVRFASDRPEIEQQINVELLEIDSVFSDLKNDLNDNMDNQDVIEAMILNYRVRLELLDVILQQLKEQGATTTENRKSYEI
jgi:hypothetical protein